MVDRVTRLCLLVGESSAEGARARRRIGVTTAVVVFFAGLLAALGLASLVLLVLAAGAVAAGAAAGVVALRGHRYRLADTVRGVWRAAASLARGVRRMAASLARGSAAIALRATHWTWPRLRSAASRSLRAAAATAAHRRDLAPGMSGLAASGGDRAGLALAWARRTTRAGSNRLRPLVADAGRAVAARTHELRSTSQGLVAQATAPRTEPSRVERQREALRLNAKGGELRREGSFAEAAAQHRAALEIFRALGDRRAEALTLNNVGLALSHGDDPGAVEAFEEAAAILRELGEVQHEGQVIANLALAHRRHGREARSAAILEMALEKLSPDSDAYRKVEEQLRRAS